MRPCEGSRRTGAGQHSLMGRDTRGRASKGTPRIRARERGVGAGVPKGEVREGGWQRVLLPWSRPFSRPLFPVSPRSCAINSGSSSFIRAQTPEAAERWRCEGFMARTRAGRREAG